MEIKAGEAGKAVSLNLWVDANRPVIRPQGSSETDLRVEATVEWDHARMDSEISGVPPGAEGLLFLPYLQGERTPNFPHGCGVLHGMTTANLTPAHMARAAMEGVTLGMAYGLRRMESLCLAPSEIRLTGGGSQSPAWCQILADVFGYPVVTMQSAEGAALGAAIQALAAAQPGSSLEELAARCSPVQSASRLEPKRADFYRDLLDKQNALRQDIF